MPTVESPLATVQDVGRFYEQAITTAEEPRVEALLDVATAKLLRLRPQLRTWIADGVVDPDLVCWALACSVLRVLRNPAGYASESVGDLSYRLSTAAASGALAFTPEELAGCTAASTSGLGLVGSARLAPPGYGVPGAGDSPWPDPWR